MADLSKAEFNNHLRAVCALVMVSLVLKALEATKNNVVSGFKRFKTVIMSV